MEVPPGFPEVDHSVGNEFTIERWDLGKKLFYDPILSKDGSISCASCHDPKLSFSDNKDFSLGVNELLGTRNAPSLANVAYHPYYTREGGVPTLEQQILVPIQEHNEFNNNIILIADTLLTINEYVEMSIKAYNQEPNAFVITRALSQFERSLISGQSAYDLEYHYAIENSMSDAAMRGKQLFESKGSKNSYRVYISGFGCPENFYLVAVSAKDELDSAMRGKANEELLGEERGPVFGNLMKYVSRFEEVTGYMRPDLSYTPK